VSARVDEFGAVDLAVLSDGVLRILARLGVENADLEIRAEGGLHRLVDFALEDGALFHLPEKGREDADQLLAVIVVGAEVEDDRVVGWIAQQAFVALVGFEDEEILLAGAIVPGEFPGVEALGEPAVETAGIGPEIGQRFGGVGGDGAFAAAAGDGDGGAEAGFRDQFREQFGAVEPGDARSGDEVGVVLFDRGGVDEVIRFAALLEIGAVLRIDFDFLVAERVDDAGVFGEVRATVAAGDGHALVAAHGGESAHADSADSDEVKMIHYSAVFFGFSGSRAGSGGMFMWRSTRIATRLKVGAATVAA